MIFNGNQPTIPFFSILFIHFFIILNFILMAFLYSFINFFVYSVPLYVHFFFLLICLYIVFYCFFKEDRRNLEF